MSYQGMRWFKCDLHMHTPVDAGHWHGSPGRADKATALAFVRRCYEAALECIAVTDHNFISKALLPLVADAARELAGEFGYHLAVFPGFEIMADVGCGMHVLGIFEPGTDMELIDHVVTKCGVPMPRTRASGAHVPSRSRLPEIIGEVQRRDEQEHQIGIVLCPHPMVTGLFDNERIAGWLQAEEWRNAELLAVEVPKPVREMSQGWQKLFANGSDCAPEWRRIRSMAAIQSSDCKALTPEEAPNHIGCRYSWIKMSSPSIEALRQAFLDHENRIRLQRDSPALDCPHGRIVSVGVQGTRFVAAQTVEFSPELNCLIGGRGSGKSSIIEYLRILTRKDQGIAEGSEAAKQLSRIRGTLTDASLLRLEWESKDGLRDTFEWKPTPPFQAETSIISRSVADPGTVFRNLGVAIYSQKQISELTDNRGAGKLLALIDGMAGSDLAALRDEEERIRGEVQQLFLAQRKQEQIETKRKIVEQEIAELSRQWEVRAAMQVPAREHKSAQDATRHLKRVLAVPDEFGKELDALAEGLTERFPALPSAAANWKHPEFFCRLDAAVQAAVEKTQAALRQAVAVFKADIDMATRRDQEWNDLAAYLNAADAVFETACQERGLNSTEVDQLREVEFQRRAKQAELDGIAAELAVLCAQVAGLTGALGRLASVWRRQTEKRRELLDTIQSGMHRVAGGKHFVEFQLITQDDETDFLEKWEALAPDRRSRLGREWQAIGQYLHSGAVFSDDSPWDHVAAALSDLSSLTLGKGLDDLKAALAEHLLVIRRDDWEKLRLQRVADSLDFTLRRQDGSVAGSLKDGGLSDGQRNTVVLSLLLVKGDGPVIVDQPEDELDSDFIYHELVPVIRQVKRKRQIILATHNANLPVNGDAELVYALKADGGHGVLRAQGGLDCGEVKDAVLDIMEGSDKAFLRRQEKYHF